MAHDSTHQIPLSIEETWRFVAGYEHLYEISDLGRARRTASGHFTWPGRVLTQHRDKDGYVYIVLSRNGKSRKFRAHHLVAEAFIYTRPDGMQINHKNGVRTDNRPCNLEWVTQHQNILHARAHTQWPDQRGEKGHTTKLTEAQVLEIRARLRLGEKQAALAEEFGLHQVTVSMIKLRKRWDHLP
jgi:hypothetical protein